MKLTNQETIQESEKEFIDTINAELDWEAIEKMLLEKHGFTLQEEIDYKDGDLIVYKDNIAYKFDFEIKVPLSVIFNREGECLEISTVRDDFEPDDQDMPDQDMPDQDMPGEDMPGEDMPGEDMPGEDMPGEDMPGEDMPGEDTDENIVDESETTESSDHPKQRGQTAQMASDIADMISEINQGDE